MSTAAKYPIETRLFINGEFVDAASGETIEVVNPATGHPVAAVQSANKDDIESAVAAAKAAFPAWSALTGKERRRYLRKLTDLVKENADELSDLEVYAVGKAKGPAMMEIDWAVDFLETISGLSEAVYGESSLNQAGHLNLSIKQPYGVVAGIIPWNVSCVMWVWKVGPAIAAGNCIILKASEKSPLAPLALARLTKEAGFPPGVVNVVNGAGMTGSYLSEHMEIRKLSFTGSTATGRRVQTAAAASNLKVVTLELGGKSPTIVFADADLKNAVDAVVLSNLVNMGQTCTANARVYVEESLAPTFLEHLKAHYVGWAQKQGDPIKAENLLGTVADALQLKQVKSFIDIGKKDGTLVAGGESDGSYVRPTLFANLADDSKLNVDEVFGPVLVFHTFKDEAEAIRRANDSEYGLYASVFTKDIDRAIRVAKQLESGQVGINTASPTLHYDVPFGGWKTSGYGKEMGHAWVESWTQTKTLLIKVASA
ncbi:putative betaine-aldehyde dehydrogenase [Artomyces pyxidatus]|uniref:Betaine-aldehyde dehydrogenase n=1 Tax=Artomyces pyxidatus TaxID=48021 RepID=A0ACB8SMH9_9AGAM|nr:putative betaine-aldehyde dehydrogenase [Artomyces pyxidatus]